jgi:DNA segregation ATPase FtsK/SpoIIIE-like protein
MFKQLSQRLSKIPAPVALIGVIIAILGAAGAALLLSRSEPKAAALVTPRAARIERVEGNVGLTHSLEPDGEDQAEWTEAAVNTPLTVGDRVYTRDNSHAAIAFTGRNYARLDSGASLDVLSLDESRTQLALRDGSALFDVGELAGDELFEVATPGGAIDFNEPGLYQVGIGDDGNTIVSVLSGLAQVVGLEGSGQIGKGEILTLVGQAATQLLVSKIAPDLAGNVVDDYYGYRYPNTYDGRYSNYDVYLDDPDYYDPYSHSASYGYLSEEIPGLYDLDRYGDWEDVDGYGRCWTPRVEANWTPYRSGYWDVNQVWGPTWVAEEPWGYAPYHYGRWAYVNNQRWTWVPEDCRTNPVYAPALVTFVPLQQTSQIAWAPLGPGERYVPRYYDANFQPQYFASREVVTEVVNVQHNYVNLNYPAAVTVVPVKEFRRRIDPRFTVPANAQLIAQSRAGLDPFAVDGVRQAARRGDFSERRMKGPRQTRQDTPVVTSVAPVIPPGRGDAAQAFQVRAVPDKQRKNRLKVDNSGQVVAGRRPDGLPEAMTHKALPAVNQERQQKMAELSQRVQQGDKTAQTQLRSLKREQRKEERAVRQMPVNQQQAAAQQAVQQGQSRKQLKQLERQQRMAGQQAQADQIKEQLKAQRQQQLQRREAPGQQQQRAVVQQGAQREQIKAQRQAERQQRQMRQQPQIQQQQRQQQQQNQAAAQQAQMNQSRKAQRQAERQQQQQQQQVQRQQQQQQMVQRQQAQQQQQQQRQQMKQQRQIERAGRQQPAPQMRPPASVTPDATTHRPGQGQGKKRKP